MTWEVRFDPLALDKKLSFLVQGGGKWLAASIPHLTALIRRPPALPQSVGGRVGVPVLSYMGVLFRSWEAAVQYWGDLRGYLSQRRGGAEGLRATLSAGARPPMRCRQLGQPCGFEKFPFAHLEMPQYNANGVCHAEKKEMPP